MRLNFAGTHAKHTYTNNQVLNGLNINGNDIDTAPRNIANLDLTWQALNNTQLALQWHRVGNYYTDPENLNKYQGHDVLSLRAQWQVTNNLEVLARIINLTDEAYAERADYTSFTGDRYFPGKPRNAMLSATYTW